MSCCGGSSRKNKKPLSPRIKHLKPKKNIKKQNIFLKTILLCRPKYFGIEYEINPWMDVNQKVNKKNAVDEWNNLHDKLKEHGAKVQVITPQNGLPDMVFTANGGLKIKDSNTVVLSKFKHEQRAKESWWFHKFFIDNKIKVFITSNYFEGAGDALFLGDTLVGGYGFRSDPAVYKEIRHLLPQEPLVVELVNSSFYHLDTCFCPLNNLDYLIFPKAFKKEDVKKIKDLKGKEIIVPEEEAKRFACNAVCLGKTVILPSDCPRTAEKLDEAGYTPIHVKMTEFLKSGGACKCLTLVI